MSGGMDLDGMEHDGRSMRQDATTGVESLLGLHVEALAAEVRLLREAVRVMTPECDNDPCCVSYHLAPDLRPDLMAAIARARKPFA